MAQQNNEKSFRFYIETNFIEAMSRTRIPGEAHLVLHVVIRKTWGWNKAEEVISLDHFCSGTGLKKPNIIRARDVLIEMNILIIKKDNAGNVSYRINKDFDSWQPLSKKIMAKKKVVIKNDNRQDKPLENKEESALSKMITANPLSKLITSVIKNDKKSLSKKIIRLNKYIYINNTKRESENQKEPPTMDSTDDELTELLLSQILKNHPTWQLSKPNEQKKARKAWPAIFSRLRQIDFRSIEQIREMILWATEHNFWTANIRSAESLRRNWDSMNGQREAESKKFNNLSDETVAQSIFQNLKKRRGDK